MKKGNGKRPVIFVGPQEIAGFLTRVAVALSREGAEVMAFKQISSSYHPADPGDPNIQWLFRAAVERLSHGSGPLAAIMLFIIKFMAFFRAAVRADSFLFIGGKGFFNIPVDYYLLRLMGKRVVHMYVGTASRPRHMSSYAMDVLSPDSGKADKAARRLKRRLDRQRRRVRAISRAASAVIENPLCGHFHERPFINYFVIGMPVDGIDKSEDQKPEPEPVIDPSNPSAPRTVRILHCPSRPEIKGTAAIEAALTPEVLATLNAELIIRTGIPRTGVLEEISQCDFVIDQLYSDSPLAGFAAEAAIHGKYPIVGGYGWDELRKFTPAEFIPPAGLCHPDELVSLVSELCRNAPLRQRKVNELRDFLKRGEWSSQAFAARLMRVMAGDIPAEWMVDPADIRYAHGVGLSEAQAREIADRVGMPFAN